MQQYIWSRGNSDVRALCLCAISYEIVVIVNKKIQNLLNEVDSNYSGNISGCWYTMLLVQCEDYLECMDGKR